MTIYVVIGETLGFDGHESWMVKGFFDDINARGYARKCVIAAESYKIKLELLNLKYRRWVLSFVFGPDIECKEKTEFDTINEYDPWFDPNCCEHEYHVEELEVDGTLYWGSHLEMPRLNYTGNENAGLTFDL